MLKKPKKLKLSRKYNINFFNLNKIQPKITKTIKPKNNILWELQKFRITFGILKKSYLQRLLKQKNKSFDKILETLNLRLDTCLIKLMFVNSYFLSKQLINHGHILINGKKIYNPSYILKIGDIITINPKIKSLIYNEIKLRNKTNLLPISNWEINYNILSAILISKPINYFTIPIDIKLLLKYKSWY